MRFETYLTDLITIGGIGCVVDPEPVNNLFIADSTGDIYIINSDADFGMFMMPLEQTDAGEPLKDLLEFRSAQAFLATSNYQSKFN